MKFSLPASLTLLSISVLMLQACSTQYSKNPQPVVSTVDVEYDAYYGKPEKVNIKSNNHARLGGGSSPFHKNAPTRYVVKKGDTLWGISRKFLKNPAYWPEIWDKNQKVQNPHRIYPGDILYIHNGKSVSGGSTKLIPTIRVTRKGIGEPISTLAPFLSWPRVIADNDLTSSPYIVAARDAKLLLEDGKEIYIKGLPNSQRGDTYGIYHAGKEIIDPETNKSLGTEISYHGQATIVHPDLITTANIEKSNREIRKGDRLIKVNAKPVALSMPIHAPSNKVRGTVISLYDASLISGQYMIAVINRGERDGIRTGHVLGVYTPPRYEKDPYDTHLDKFHSKQSIEVKLPPERVGSMIVYNVGQRYSYALINKSDVHIKKGYKIGNP
jgi:LysM repeat protein